MSEYLREGLQKEDLTLLTKIEIPLNVYNKSRRLDPYLLRFLEQSIRLLPLYGGYLDQNANYQVIVCFQNSKNIIAEWDDSDYWDKKLKLIILNTDLEKWLYQRRRYFGWK